MPSAANAKSEKPAATEAADNSPIRQIMTIIEHKIRNLEKRKGKLTSYRDLQKAGKELNADQKVAVAKYDEVVQTLEFARDMSKQVAGIAISAERDAKKQAKKDAWVRSAAETNKIREVLLVLDCLVQMGNTEARNDFLNGTNGAAKLTEDDLKILDGLYPEVTPKHEVNEEGQPGFHSQTIKAAEHLYSIIDGRPKEILGTTYTHIKEIVTAVHECGYFDRSLEIAIEIEESQQVPPEEQELVEPESEPEPEVNAGFVPPPATLPVPPAPAVVPAPAYPLRPIPPITLQEVEHAYFAQQYPQQRPIAEVIGSQNFFFLQESEIDSPVGTPAPPQLPAQGSPTGVPALPIPTQTFTNQHFVMRGPGPEVALPQPHFPHPEHAGFAPVQLSQVPHAPHVAHVSPHGPTAPLPTAAPAPVPMPIPVSAPVAAPEDRPNATPEADRPEDEPKDDLSPERDDTGDRRTHGQGDGQARFRRFGRGRGAPNGHRGRGTYSGRPNDGYRGRNTDYVPRGKDYSNRQYDGYRKERDDSYYGNGDASDTQHENGRERHYDGYRGRGRGAPRGSRPAPRTPRAHHYARKPDRLD